MSDQQILTLPTDVGTIRDVYWYMIKFGMIPLFAWLPTPWDNDDDCSCYSIFEDYTKLNERWKSHNNLNDFINTSPELLLYKDYMIDDDNYGEGCYVIKNRDKLTHLLNEISGNGSVGLSIKKHAQILRDFIEKYADNHVSEIRSIEISNFWSNLKKYAYDFQTKTDSANIFKLSLNSPNESYIELIIQIFGVLVKEYDIMVQDSSKQKSEDSAAVSKIFQFTADNLNKLSAINADFVVIKNNASHTHRLNFYQVYTSNDKDKFKNYNLKEITLVSRGDMKLHLAYPYSLMPTTSKILGELFLKKCILYDATNIHFFSTIQSYLIWAKMVVHGQESSYYDTNSEIGLIDLFDETMLSVFLSAYRCCPQTGERLQKMSFIESALSTIISNVPGQIDAIFKESKKPKQGGDDVPARVLQPVGQANWSLNVYLLFAIFLIICFYIFVESSKNNTCYIDTTQPLFTAAEIGAREPQPQ
jgi:hypothetical protein